MSDEEHRQTLLTPTEETLPTHTQYGLSRSEIFQGIANRFIYSRFYSILYLGLVGLCAVSITLSLYEKCPSFLFILLEIIINIAMIIEVSIRMVAIGRPYFYSGWNIIDVLLVILCFSTLLAIISGECSEGERSEAILDTALLIIRNLIQFSRLGMMIKKNSHTINTRTQRIDFSDVRGSNSSDLRGVSIDFGAFEPEGVEHNAASRPTTNQQRPFVLDETEDDDF